METVGAEIRRVRKEYGQTQEELAAYAGLSTRTVHLLETGQGSIRLDNLERILDVLGLKLAVVSKSGMSHE